MSNARLARRSTAYVLLGFLAPAVNFLLQPLFSNLLAPQDYAIIALSALAQAVVTPLVGLGVNGSFARLYYDVSRHRPAVDAMMATSFFIFLLSVAGLLVTGWLLGPAVFSLSFKSDAFTFYPYGYLVIATALGGNLQLLVLSMLRNAEQARQYIFWAILFFISSAAGILIGVAGLRLGALGSVAGRMVGTMLPVLVYIALFFWRRRRTAVVRPYMARRLLVYGLPLVPYLLLNVAFNNVDKVLVEQYFDLDVLGMYSFAMLVASVIEIFNSAISGAMYPPLFREVRNNPAGLGAPRVREVLRMVLLVSFAMNALVFGLGSPVIRWLINPRYHEALAYLPLLCAAFVPRALWIAWSMPMMYAKKVKQLPLINAVALAASVGSSLLLLPRIGLYALPVSLFLAQATMVLGGIYFSRRLGLDMRQIRRLWPEHLLGLALVLLAVAATLGYALITPTVWWHTGAMGILAVVVLIAYRGPLAAFAGPLLRKLPFFRSGPGSIGG